ncbi:MAG: DUF4340 domain-containing protein [Verrucomicrobia bacterium]|nr:DUF4340 domain-containing protein [Verrucomicrobiota bacterium]
MKPKNTFILFLATALIVGGYFLLKKRMPTTDEQKEKEKRVFDFKSPDVTEVGIKGVDRDFLFEKQNQKWMIKRPLQVRANSSEIDGILSMIEFLDSHRRLSPKEIAEAKLSLSDYGLDKPRLIATFKTSKGAKTLNAGNEAKQGNRLYAQVSGDPNVHLVDKDVATRLGKKLDDYRERSLFDFTASQIHRFEIKNGPKLLEFSKTNNLWRVIQPLNARADTTKVDDFLKQISGLRAEDFLSDDPAAAREYGLDEPPQEVTMRLEQQDAIHTVLVGQKVKNDDKKVAVKVKGQNSIVAVSSNHVADVVKPLNDFRDHNLATYTSSDVAEIDFRQKQLQMTLQKDGDAWKIVQPEKLDADKDLVDGVLSKLNSMQIKEFSADVLTDLDKFGLKTPFVAVVLRGKPSESDGATNATRAVLLNLAVGKEETSKKFVYVKLADESSVYALDSSGMADIPKGVTDLRSRVLFQIKKDALKSVAQKKGKTPATVERGTDGKWKLGEGTEGVLDEKALEKFQNQIESFKVEKIIGPALNATLKQYGMESPVVTLTAKTETDGKAVAQEIVVGRETSQKKYHVIWKNQLLLCEITREMHESLAADLLAKPASK